MKAPSVDPRTGGALFFAIFPAARRQDVAHASVAGASSARRRAADSADVGGHDDTPKQNPRG